MNAQRTSADTQAVLLLAATMGTRGDAYKPLSPSEYSHVAEVMHANSLRPADLFEYRSAEAFNELVRHFDPKAREKITSERLYRLMARGGMLSVSMERWTQVGIWVVSRADDRYPDRYKRVLKKSAPPVVFGIGPDELLRRGGLAVVGTRKPDPSSEEYTRRVGAWAADHEVQVVSGAANGVDSIAMLSAVAAGGTALGIVAESLIQMSTKKIFREAIMDGRLTLISSFDPDAAFNVGNAMARNKWIYALADRALVVACSNTSNGTWNGAVEAIKAGATVFTRVGNPERRRNEELVSLGAIPITDDLQLLLDKDPGAHAVSVLSAAQRATHLSANELFETITPILLRYFSTWLTAKEFAKRADLVPAQAKAWLERLVASGQVEKAKTKFRAYTHSDAQPSLFEPKT